MLMVSFRLVRVRICLVSGSKCLVCLSSKYFITNPARGPPPQSWLETLYWNRNKYNDFLGGQNND